MQEPGTQTGQPFSAALPLSALHADQRQSDADAHVVIVLATFNGAAFITEQLKSLLHQTHRYWSLFIRDDGSTDDTVAICRAFSERDARIQLVIDNLGNLGVIKNFEVLLNVVRHRADYVMFCDQDDIWHPDKIALTLQAVINEERAGNSAGLSSGSLPVLVHTDLRIVGRQAQELMPSLWGALGWESKCNAFSRLLVQNSATGCTVLINRPLLDLVTGFESGVIMHDWWLALVASAFGSIVSVPIPTIDYRQHGGNSVGVSNSSTMGKVRIAVQRLHARKKEFIELPLRQAKLFKAVFSSNVNFSADVGNVLQRFIDLQTRNWLSRKANLIAGKYWRHSWLGTVLLVLIV